MLENKSLTTEKATIELINTFADKIDFPEVDHRNRRVFQLPLEEINDENWRYEATLPVDKYDWILFDRIYHTVWFPSDTVRKKLCFKDYENINEDMFTFRVDCMDLFSHFNNKMIAALAHSSKQSLDILRKRLFT